MIIKELIGELGHVLACPFCTASLLLEDGGLCCTGCSTGYPLVNDGQIDLRLQSPKQVTVEFEVGGSFFPEPEFGYQPLDPPPDRFSRELMTYMSRASRPGAFALDLGCGTTVHQPMLEQMGYRYVGIDYKDENAPILADAHALPFRDESFDFILNLNVLEHLQYPHVAYSEAWRVLQSGCRLLGSVAFLEPFHDSSFFHHTHLGTHNTVATAGFVVDVVAPNVHWPVLKALVRMNAVPRSVKPLLRMAQFLIDIRRYIRPLTMDRVLRASGSFFFIAHKQ